MFTFFYVSNSGFEVTINESLGPFANQHTV